MELNISDIKVGKRFRKDMGDIPALAASMEELGLLQPVAITEDHRLIAGQRRLKAAKDLGWQKVKVNVVKTLKEAIDLLKAERDENTCREPHKLLEARALGNAIAELVRPKMKERQAHEGRSGKLPERLNGEPATTRDAAAAAAGMSPRTYAKVDAVAKAAEEDPETFGPIAEEMNLTGKVDPAYKKVKAIADPPPEPEPPEYPHSDMMSSWIERITGQGNYITHELGGIEKLLKEEDKWDWDKTRTYLLPMFAELPAFFKRYQDAMSHAVKQRRKKDVS